MIYPPIRQMIEKANSRYSLVIATAKRARELSESETKEVSKPIIEAIREIHDGEIIIVASEKKAEADELQEEQFDTEE